jgi:5-oxoprolinase (ATP-hydrolysing) subunit A
VTAPPAIAEVDLNADAGESFGRYTLADDEALMRSVTSVSIACGWHAGDPGVIRRTVALARAAGVSVGAHPSYPDLQGFGRRAMVLSPDELTDGVIYQVSAVAGLAAAEGVALSHVKPHGALYNTACRDTAVARAIARGIVAVDRSLAIFAPPDSPLAEAAATVGLAVVAEGFADRAYEADGSLMDRSNPGAVLHDREAIAARVAAWMQSGMVPAAGGARLSLRVQTICVHGDAPGASETCAAIRHALVSAGVRVRRPRDL